MLAALYVYSTPVVALLAHSFLFASTAVEVNAGAWLWVSWRITLPLAIVLYALLPRRHGNITAATSVAFLVAAVTIVLAYSNALPPMAIDGAYTLAGAIANVVSIATVMVALVCMLRVRPLTSLDTWLLVLIATIAVRYPLIALNAQRLSHVPDAIWVFSGLIANFCIMLALAIEVSRLLERSVVFETLYRRESEITKHLQAAFLPMSLPTVQGLRFDAVYRPALREFGGDWYDAFLIEDGRVALVIGDIAGHGVDAALEMVRLRETVRAMAGVNGSSAATVLEGVDRAFRPSNPEKFATAALALYDPLTARLEYAYAGHPPLALVRAGTATFLKGASGLPLGVEPHSRFTSQWLSLEVGDRIALYTDGLIESTGDADAGEARLALALAAHVDVAGVVEAGVADSQNDDVALLQVTVLENVARTIWSFEADDAASAADARRSFITHLRLRSADSTLLFAAELAFGELIGNVVRHSPGSIEVDLIVESDLLYLVVRDRGEPFSPDTIGLPDDLESENGRGLFLISALAAPPLVTRRAGKGNQVTVCLGDGFGEGPSVELRSANGLSANGLVKEKSFPTEG